MEVAGLILGGLGIAGLFKACVENFDIVVRAKDFSEEFDLLCTQLSLHRVRLLIWGETLGLVPSEGKSTVCYNATIDRPDIRPAVEAGLNHLRNLLSKADVITGRYEVQESQGDQEGEDDGDSTALTERTSKGMTIFRSKFDKFKARLRQNQKQTSTWKVTRWSVHDYDKFRALIADIKEIIDGLRGITDALGTLPQQEAALIEEIESISDTQSLRLLQTIGSKSSAPSALRTISDTASQRISTIESKSFYTAPTHAAEVSSVVYSVEPRVGVQAAGFVDAQGQGDGATTPVVAEPTLPTLPMAPDLICEIPQHQRWMAALAIQRDTRPKSVSFTSGDKSYGSYLKPVKEADDTGWATSSTKLIGHADKGSPLAQRAFAELRCIRKANVPFISAALVEDRVDRLLASIEGPPDTPYEGGIFWITVQLVLNRPPMLRFRTRIYHPNIDCTGKLCADYEEWWTDENLRAYLGVGKNPSLPWFSEHRSNNYSLGAVLVALCGLLASPNADDPLVPEIAAKYISDYEGFVRAARLYTERYALDRAIPEDLTFADDDTCSPAVLIATDVQPKTESTKGLDSASATFQLWSESERSDSVWPEYIGHRPRSLHSISEVTATSSRSRSWRNPWFSTPQKSHSPRYAEAKHADENKKVTVNGATYVLPADYDAGSRKPRHHYSYRPTDTSSTSHRPYSSDDGNFHYYGGDRGSDNESDSQFMSWVLRRDARSPPGPVIHADTRRAAVSVPQRPASARPVWLSFLRFLAVNGRWRG